MVYDYSKVFDIYNALPHNVKKDFDKFRAENYSKSSPPPEQMQKDLESIITKHQPKTKSPATSSDSEKRMQYAIGLIGVLTAIAALSMGIPYTPPLY